MFTGIVQQLGEVRRIDPGDHGCSLVVDTRGWSQQVQPGDSIAVNGCCLTATTVGATLGFDVIRQTLSVTALGDLQPGSEVNLEAAVTPATLMSGHIVQGHVDGIATLVHRDEDHRLRVRAPLGLQRFIIDKGSVALDGVSLTVATLGDDWFEVALIPTTLAETTLGAAPLGGRLNLEVDYLVKAVARLMDTGRAD